MVVKGNVGISDRKIAIYCPECGKQHEEFLVEIENKKEAVCPHCVSYFKVKV